MDAVDVDFWSRPTVRRPDTTTIQLGADLALYGRFFGIVIRY